MKWFLNLQISTKLISSFVLVAIMAGVVGLVGVLNIRTVERNDTNLYTNMTVPLSEAAQLAKLFQRVRVNTRDMILENDIEKIESNYATIKQISGQFDVLAKSFDATILNDTAVRAVFDTFVQSRTAFLAHLDQLLVLARANQDQEAFALVQGAMRQTADAEMGAIDKLVELKVAAAKITAEANVVTADRATTIMIVIIAGGMLLAIALGIFIARVISSPIRHLAVAAESIADGDLNVSLDIHTKEEIGALAAAFRRMSDNLNDVMSNISLAAEQVASGSKQVSESSMALSQGATEQASSIEQLTASLEEISAQTRQNAESATQANGLAETAKVNAAQGNLQMKGMLQAMDEINDSSSNISKIIKVIDEIAFQTNILALNAAVEAARAGQHGKGFAVVAEEVRNLAARSANAAKETTAMIEGSIKKVEGGTKIANQTADALDRIVEGVATVARLVGSIATASSEQAAGIGQVSQGIMQVSQVVQTNSATSEESASASEELAGQAEMLREQAARFRLKTTNRSVSPYRATEEYNQHEPSGMSVPDRNRSRQFADSRTEAAATKPRKIALSDREFGKY